MEAVVSQELDDTIVVLYGYVWIRYIVGLVVLNDAVEVD